VTITLREIPEDDAGSVLVLQLAPGQERFVSSVADSLAEAAEHPEGNPWYRAVHADGEPVGFVMLSWNVRPQPPWIIGPWFLWKLLIDERHQRRGYGRDVVRLVAQIVRENGAIELLTSCVPGADGPEAFYRRLGFVRTGDVDENSEVILALRLARDS
jgi:RimJ/RimL family protein N-acetyltransferase